MTAPCRNPCHVRFAHWQLFVALGLLAGSLCLPVPAAADAALDRALYEQLERVIADDDMPELRRFERRAFGGLVPDASDTAESGSSWWREHILRQLPPEAASLLPDQPVGVLRLEACGPLLSSYGIAERADLGFDYGNVDRIRVTIALAAEGLGAGVPLEHMNALRDDTDDGGALRALNTSLFQQYAEGRTESLYMVLDDSEGCGSEIPSAITIRSSRKLHAVNVIPDFYFSVCETRFADPWDLSRCPWWDDTPQQLMVTGSYHWQGRLRSGGVRTGRIELDLDGPNWDTQEIVVR